MWDDAEALRKLSNALFGLSTLLVLVGALHYVIHLPLFALRAVQLSAAPQRVDAAQIEEVARNQLRGNFFTVDLVQVRRAFEQLPWVRKASVRRQFPWQLEVTLEEHVALARWNGAELVNVQGEVFAAEDKGLAGLPAFTGPGGAAVEVAQYYDRFGSALAPLKQQIVQVGMSPRGAWRLRLQNGMTLELGREQMEQRLARFVAAYPASAGKMLPPVQYVDLRYRNGFAARVAG